MFAGLSEQDIWTGARGDPLTFKDTRLPGRVYLGAIAYQLREYVRPPPLIDSLGQNRDQRSFPARQRYGRKCRGRGRKEKGEET